MCSSDLAPSSCFRRNGVYRQQLLGAVLVGLFLAGVKPHTLKRFYGEVR